jgi:hypothetical protein
MAQCSARSSQRYRRDHQAIRQTLLSPTGGPYRITSSLHKKSDIQEQSRKDTFLWFCYSRRSRWFSRFSTLRSPSLGTLHARDIRGVPREVSICGRGQPLSRLANARAFVKTQARTWLWPATADEPHGKPGGRFRTLLCLTCP